jgi:murein DD-endopeptidase MepM/ murein hydrolase activator NlpD
MVELDHGFGIHTIYAHCQTLRVREGDYVERGDLLGTIGTTGQSTGPHLHFEVRLEGHAVDPMDYLPR